jgi:uncharacterized protein YidB (DUF937 family)
MGILDSVTSKLGGQEGQDGGISSLQKMINSNGGLHGLTSKLSQSGLGKEVQSWVGNGDNKPVTGDQIKQAVGPNDIHSMAKQAGMSDQECCDQVAKAIPDMVDKATPQGQLPEQDPFAKGMDTVKRMLKL